MEHLFVYGTLAPGRPNEHILADVPGTWQSAIVFGTLIDEGWGAELGYPGIIPNASGSEVQGFLFSSTQLAECWAMLDEFEGEAYQRVLVHARCEDGQAVDAHIYALKEAPNG